MITRRARHFLNVAVTLVLLPCNGARLSPNVRKEGLYGVSNTCRHVVLCACGRRARLTINGRVTFKVLGVLFRSGSKVKCNRIHRVPDLKVVLRDVRRFRIFQLRDARARPFATRVEFVRVFRSIAFLLLC